MKHVLLFLTLCFSGVVEAQLIKGYITDESSGKPLPYVNIYFANTTIGSSTDAEGFFVIKNFKPGKYDLTVSYVGYQTFSLPVELPADTVVDVNIKLKEDLVSLPEVFVMADTSNWESNFAVFKDYFLGTTPARSDCEIKNKKTLLFYFDQSNKILYAHAREPIIIENNWLGYKISYDLHSFELNFKSQKLGFYGVPRFTNLKSDKSRVEKRWVKRRLEAYNGSGLHFFRSLYNQRLFEEGFETHEIIKVLNPDRPADDVIDSALMALKERQTKKIGRKSFVVGNISDVPRTLEDSIVYYSRLKRKPRYLDKIGAFYKTGEQLIKDNDIVSTGILQITYKDYVMNQYPMRNNSSTGERQKSKLYIIEPIKIYSNGYYESVRNTYLEGYWSWTGSLANLLPLNYYPK